MKGWATAGKFDEVAGTEKLSAKYLSALWQALTDRAPSQPLDALRAKWNAAAEKDVPAPDVNTNAQIMAWFMDTYSMHVGHTSTAVVTGKPLELGGSLGRREATGRGVMIVARESARHLGFDLAGARVAVQGFGNVGGTAARFIVEQGARLIAVADARGGVANEAGLDVARLLAWYQEHGTVSGSPGGEPIDNAQLLAMDCDILIPAALENQITAENAGAVKAKIVAEGANGPCTPDADADFARRGIFVIPDILCNAGGVTVSYFEWVQDLNRDHWTEANVNAKLREIITSKQFDRVVTKKQDRDAIVADNKAMEGFIAKDAWRPENVGIPLHPGAIRYYKERGWM